MGDRLQLIEDGLYLAALKARGAWRLEPNAKGLSPLVEMEWLLARVRAMEAVMDALAALELATENDDGNAPSYALVPLNEMGWLWEAYEKYKAGA